MQDTRKGCALSGLGVVMFLLGHTFLCAQNAGGTIRGVVRDESGLGMSSARVMARIETLKTERTASCDHRGEFRMDDLKPGAYVVMITSPGFAEASANVTVVVDTIRDLRVTMKPAAHESVHVHAATSSITMQPVDSASQVLQGIVTHQDLESFPLAQRSFANIAYLAPGTEPVEPSDPTKARITAVSTGGSSGLNNDLSIDGMDNSDDYIGGFLQNIPSDAIEEFSMRTAQEDADTGGTTAGSVVIVTRRGSDVWHGGAAVFERAAALNARFAIENPAPEPKQPYSRQDYVGTLGGPIEAGRLWFFSSFAATHEDATIAYSNSSTEQFNGLAALAAAGLIPGVSTIVVPSTVPIPFRDASETLRLDWSQSARSSWYMRASGDGYSTRNNLVQQATLPSTGLFTENRYWNAVLGNQCLFSPRSIGILTVGVSKLHLTQTRNANLGFALAFPFSSTALTISGFETFGDNQFATPITFFPSLRNQEKYQFRYDFIRESGRHSFKAGVNFIHEPVLSGAFPGNSETLYQLQHNPTFYLDNPAQFAVDMAQGASTSQPKGAFAQNVQRLGFYAQDSWRATPGLNLSLGIHYSTSFGLFEASRRTQEDNPAFITLRALEIPLVDRAAKDDREQFGPRIGLTYSVDRTGSTVIRAGFGIFLNDLAQNGWATAFQAVHSAPGSCVNPVQEPTGVQNAGCVPGHNLGGTGNVIAPNYQTPYALHISVGLQRSFSSDGSFNVDYIHEQGDHGYRAYSYTGGTNLFTPLLNAADPRQADLVPDVNDFHSDNRSSYDALLVHLQDNIGHRFNLIANYTMSKARTWGCVLGELFDYVNGVCDPLNPFGPGDYGPSGEDVRHRFVFAGVWRSPGGLEISSLTQAEGARPFTITTVDGRSRIAINGHPTALDEFRGTPYIQADARVARPIKMRERWSIEPFIEFFNLFNRTNPGANFVTNVASLSVPAAEAQAGNVTHVCLNSECTTTSALTNPDQLRVPAGALGDFFGPGTTVGTPFAAQVGIRIEF